ncbi:RNA polymerase, sigma 54 subunit, RpoN [Caldimicrobium thiodismutans]|uniref:RNA polymerase, sigma 54 subunit, RpoN n=1 Tax=Caldimicrobium thiodismutans TaxID=1653476 RepID=A0A0U5AWK4_9BACT|nr:RNA polymerase factor sigma-54 [Caldimicrobium thiodismutans]BAU22942.1 RNA polymerase, sigma 54 subunit, RpoN [Caldimicrobium thiodismutans]
MIEIKNQLKLVPQLILTPQLKLTLKVLQLNILELNEYLLQEAQVNPFLEIEFRDLYSGRSQVENREDITLVDEFHWDEESLWERRVPSFSFEEGEDEIGSLIERTVGTEETLTQHLYWQLGFLELSPLQREIAGFIMGNLDDKGYLSVPVEELAIDINVLPEEVEKVRRLLQRLDPVGVASLDLRECLLVQLEFLGYKDSDLPYKLVAEHLSELVQNIETLSKKLDLPIADLQEAMEIIKNLEPFPARNFSSTKGLYIEPDLRFYKEEEEWKVEILNEKAPRVYLSPLYYKIIQNKRLLNNGKGKEFLKEKFKMAENLLKALDSRYSTLYKVGEAILKAQRDFLERGVSFLKPLTLKDLSQVTGLHESTISRVISHKYVDTPLGLYPLKFFFSTGYDTHKGESLSAVAIKNYIKEIVQTEDPKKPLSDSEIGSILSEKYGIKIARRTVTKYREELNIPSIRERRKKIS